MSLKFGTSGIRGLATDLTDEACGQFAEAFLRHYENRRCESLSGTPKKCLIAGDLRESTPRILAAISEGLIRAGYSPVLTGTVPTPALAYGCLKLGIPGIMVTGSHIPADRNGIKFYFPWGEILKEDEAGILEQKANLGSTSPARPQLPVETWDAEAAYLMRYLEAIPVNALSGLKIAFFEHSSVARSVFPKILSALGAEVICFGSSDTFVPVDTEALDRVEWLANQVRRYQAHCLLSTDGDGDRPLFLDETGEVVRGDQLGIIGAKLLDADSVSTPLSSSTALEALGGFQEVRRCKIGSPFVIAAMKAAITAGMKRVVGFEANGGFLVGTEFQLGGKEPLAALPTRDSVLPALLTLMQSKLSQQSVSQTIANLPARFVESCLIRPFPVEASASVLKRLAEGGLPYFSEYWGGQLGPAVEVNTLDGVRVTFQQGDILHFRPSGNAPEFRIYTESDSVSRARHLASLAEKWQILLEF